MTPDQIVHNAFTDNLRHDGFLDALGIRVLGSTDFVRSV